MTTKKHCSGCDRDLDLDNFAWHNKAKGIYQRWCRECLRQANKVHYQNNTQIYKERALTRNSRVITEIGEESSAISLLIPVLIAVTPMYAVLSSIMYAVPKRQILASY